MRSKLEEIIATGYPIPNKYKTREKLIIDYTQKVGESQGAMKFKQWMESQPSVAKAINEKYSSNKLVDYKIG